MCVMLKIKFVIVLNKGGNPMLYIPLTTTPLGWLILGAGGYALYKAGKKRGSEEAVIEEVPESEPTETKGEK